MCGTDWAYCHSNWDCPNGLAKDGLLGKRVPVPWNCKDAAARGQTCEPLKETKDVEHCLWCDVCRVDIEAAQGKPCDLAYYKVPHVPDTEECKQNLLANSRARRLVLPSGQVIPLKWRWEPAENAIVRNTRYADSLKDPRCADGAATLAYEAREDFVERQNAIKARKHSEQPDYVNHRNFQAEYDHWLGVVANTPYFPHNMEGATARALLTPQWNILKQGLTTWMKQQIELPVASIEDMTILPTSQIIPTYFKEPPLGLPTDSEDMRYKRSLHIAGNAALRAPLAFETEDAYCNRQQTNRDTPSSMVHQAEYFTYTDDPENEVFLPMLERRKLRNRKYAQKHGS